MTFTLALSVSEPAGHGLSQKALEIAAPFGFPITNSMIVTWIVAAALILFALTPLVKKMTPREG